MAGPVRNPPRQETRAMGHSHSPLGSPALLPTVAQSIPRPPNAWILYRSDRLKNLAPLPEGQKRAQSAVSKQLSHDWAHESQEIRDKYEKLADQRKAEHHIMYPNYRFTPMKKEEKAALREAKKKAREEAKKLRGRARGRRTASKQHTGPTPAPTLPAAAVAGLLPMSLASYPHAMPAIPYFPTELFGAAGPSPPMSAASSPEPIPESESPSDLSKASTPEVNERPLSAPTLSLPHAPAPVRQGHPSANPYMAYFSNGGPGLVYTQPDAIAAGRLPALLTPPTLIDYQQQQGAIDGAADRPGHQRDGQSMPEGSLHDGVQDSNMVSNNVDLNSNSGSELHDWIQGFDQQQIEMLSFNVDPNTYSMGQGFDQADGALVPFNQYDENGIFSLGMFDPNLLTADLPDGELILDFGNFSDPQTNMDFYGMFNSLPDPATANDTQQLFAATNPVPEQQHYVPSNTVPDTSQQYMGTSYNTAVPQQQQQQQRNPAPASTSSLSPALSVDLSNTEPIQKNTYVPPSGAAFSSTRRVGGRWKPPISTDDSLDNYSNFVHVS